MIAYPLPIVARFARSSRASKQKNRRRTTIFLYLGRVHFLPCAPGTADKNKYAGFGNIARPNAKPSPESTITHGQRPE